MCGPRYDASVKIKKLHDDHGLPGTRTPADPRFGTGLGQKKGGPLTATRLDNRPHRPTATHCRRHGGHCGRTRYSPTSSPADPLAGDARAAAGRCGYRTGLHPDHHRCHRRRPEPAGRHGHRRPHHLPDSRAVLLASPSWGAIVTAQWPGDLAEADIDPAGFTAGISAGFAVNAGLALAAAAFAVVIRTHTGTARNGPRQRPSPLDAAGLNPDASGRDLHIYPPGPPVIGSATGSSSGPNAARAVAHRRATLPPREVVEAA